MLTHCHQGTRILKLSCSVRDPSDNSEYSFKIKTTCNSGSLAMLQANAESRKIALRNYSPRFGEIRHTPIYFSHERDIIVVCTKLTWCWDGCEKKIPEAWQRSLGLVQNVVFLNPLALIHPEMGNPHAFFRLGSLFTTSTI
jgi:2EXR family